MATPITDDEIATAARGPAETEIDGHRTKARPISELIAAQGVTALDGTSTEGGPVSGWGAAVRPARVVLPGAS